jgi:hypothetical protein
MTHGARNYGCNSYSGKICLKHETAYVNALFSECMVINRLLVDFC